ncbi:hypothetical protein GTA51_13300 [Desulfovibrio aerotolerans]|uniref:Uncharacterized protein n=1 Tax=Solidesulfovibrio aerotolerans TaxID=295255 RepID=A0A7C9IVP6_9BACT|nr:hypothetical protein [Solidesulfovibrio aerotolerans]MYL84103.1 hypothetical protein [Solidesulfovibrio aerotolerans]
MQKSIRILTLAVVLALPVQGFAAGNMTLAQQQTPPPFGYQQDQPPGQPPQEQQPWGQQQGQPQGQQHRGGYGVQQPRPPMVPPPVMVAPMPSGPPPGYAPSRRHQNRQAKALMRCNQRQTSCARNCNYRTRGRSRTMCNNQCNVAFVSCTTRANMR